jgi:hypothetical protein
MKSLGEIAFETSVGRWAHPGTLGWKTLEPHARLAWEDCANAIFREIIARGYIKTVSEAADTAKAAITNAAAVTSCKVCSMESVYAAFHPNKRCYNCAEAGK